MTDWSCPDTLEALAAEACLRQCERCGAWLQFVPGQRNPDAKILRKSATPEGYCVNCAAAHFLQHGPEPLRSLVTPAALRQRQVQEHFGSILAAGLADAQLEEIDWDKVIGGWSLPFPCVPTDGFSCRMKREGEPDQPGRRRSRGLRQPHSRGRQPRQQDPPGDT